MTPLEVRAFMDIVALIVESGERKVSLYTHGYEIPYMESFPGFKYAKYLKFRPTSTFTRLEITWPDEEGQLFYRHADIEPNELLSYIRGYAEYNVFWKRNLT